jgi:tripartite-type tricarboxylate transporter receptor subunit TctC
LRYDTFKDLAPVAFVASSPLVLAVHPTVPGRNLKEFVEAAKKDPSKLNFANPGPGSPHHLAFELLSRTVGMEIGQANYRGGGPALNDVVAGHAQVGMFTFGAVRPFIQGGQVKPLALLTEKRSDLAPELPTAVEAGWPAVHVALRFVVMTRAGTANEIITRMHAAIAESVNEPEFQQMLRQQGYEPFVTNPAETGALLRSESVRWAPILKAADIRLD